MKRFLTGVAIGYLIAPERAKKPVRNGLNESVSKPMDCKSHHILSAGKTINRIGVPDRHLLPGWYTNP